MFQIKLKDEFTEEKSHSKESHFIQLIDLILGCVFQNLSSSSNLDSKSNLAMKLKSKLLKACDYREKNKNLFVSFFPKKKAITNLNLDNSIKTFFSKDNFYYLKEDMLILKDNKNTTLSKFF